MNKWLVMALLIGGLLAWSCEESKLKGEHDMGEISTPSEHNTEDPSKALEKTRIVYGDSEFNFGDLIIPNASGKRPVIMIIHGGCWRSSYDYTLMDSMAVDLARRGYATWNVEYRRTEDEGGRWPGTITDVADALKHLISLGESYPIDLDNILVTGHSAGGHLALMLGAQHKMEADNPLKVEGLPPIKGIVSLAGITDLNTYLAPSGCGSNVLNLVDGQPDEVPDRYRDGSPISYLPLGIPQILVNGESDDIVSVDHITPYFNQATNLGDDIKLVSVEGAGHFEVIQPGSIAWESIIKAYEELLGD